MKKIKSILLIIIVIFLTGCDSNDNYLMDYGDYAKITKDNIKQIEIIRYTEAGDHSEIVEEDQINSIYNNLKKRKIGSQNNRSCDDNTVIYIFTLTDDTSLKIEIECENVILDENRYVLE